MEELYSVNEELSTSLNVLQKEYTRIRKVEVVKKVRSVTPTSQKSTNYCSFNQKLKSRPASVEPKNLKKSYMKHIKKAEVALNKV